MTQRTRLAALESRATVRERLPLPPCPSNAEEIAAWLDLIERDMHSTAPRYLHPDWDALIGRPAHANA
jgi:hypothetical protein